MDQTIIRGQGSINNLTEILRENRPGHIFLVTGKNSFVASGAETLLRKIISPFPNTRFSDFEVNPKLEDIQKGVEQLKTSGSDYIIGIGGGSVMDTAKAISVLACNHGNAEDFVKGKKALSDDKIPTTIIPTTAGTGSESTHFSVVYIGKTKYSLAGEAMLPDVAVLDHGFTHGLSPGITAFTGMDALCQGIESFWSVNSTEESRRFSEKAITFALSSLEKAVNDPDDASRETMLLASNYAGRAINIAKTTAAHAVSYPFTSYFNIPHGHAVALTLPHFIEFNHEVDEYSVQDKRGFSFTKQRIKELLEIMGCRSARGAKNHMVDLMRKIGLETRLSHLGMSGKDIEIIIENGFNPQRVKNNPRQLTESQLRTLLESIL